MTLEDFAIDAGVTVHPCAREWGGPWGYSTPDAPNCKFNGYTTKEALYRAWAENTFGKRATAALLRLIAA